MNMSLSWRKQENSMNISMVMDFFYMFPFFCNTQTLISKAMRCTLLVCCVLSFLVGFLSCFSYISVFLGNVLFSWP